MPKIAGLLENANDFLEAALRCSWSRFNKNVPVKRQNEPMQIPEKVNMSFACELYIKAIAENQNITVGKVHKLDKLFKTTTSPKPLQRR